jgi:hypothetical protein
MSIEKEHGIVPDRAVVQHFATDTVMIKKEMTFEILQICWKCLLHKYNF